MPAPQTLGNRAQAFVDERRAQLNCYLQAVMRIPAVAGSPEMRAVLGLVEAGVTRGAHAWLQRLPPPAAAAPRTTIWDQGAGSFIAELAVEVRLSRVSTSACTI